LTRFVVSDLGGSPFSRKLWKPHPDDEAEVREAAESVDRGEVLSGEA
jgi:hypothetical protein